MSRIIIGTAGHIDHGKTALIKALTGVDLDRLKEEKERGITIELGFGSLSLSHNERIGIVDVPGHERFIRRMVAGAGGIDIVLLVVAADDGVMPQTKEHLDICQLLGIKHGIVVISKSDLVDEDWLELVAADIAELVKGTFLEGAPLIPVSSVTGQGIRELIAALERLVPEVSPKLSEGICFLPVDRIFTIKGFGTVVTGTLISGAIRVGETLEILPRGFRARVRGVQVHGDAAEISVAGQRTAINLQGVEKGMLTRGDVLTHPQALKPSYRFDVQLTILPHAPQPLKHGEQVRLHLFSATAVARIISYDGNVLDRGGSYVVQFRFPDPLVSIPGARFVIRTIDASRTIGGGVILDTDPLKHRRNDSATQQWFESLRKQDLEAVLTGLAKASETQGISRQEVLRRIDARAQDVERTWKHLAHSGTLVELTSEQRRAVHQETIAQYTKKFQAMLEAFHAQNPLRPGIPSKEIQQQLERTVTPRFFEHLVQELERRNVVAVRGDLIQLAAHEISLSDRQRELKQKIEALLSSQALSPSSLPELMNNFSVSNGELTNLLEMSAKEGELVKVKNDLYFPRAALERLKEEVIQYLREHKELTPGSFKEITGASRKYSIPLLEYLDREKVTIRVGDKRILRERKV